MTHVSPLLWRHDTCQIHVLRDCSVYIRGGSVGLSLLVFLGTVLYSPEMGAFVEQLLKKKEIIVFGALYRLHFHVSVLSEEASPGQPPADYVVGQVSGSLSQKKSAASGSLSALFGTAAPAAPLLFQPAPKVAPTQVSITVGLIITRLIICFYGSLLRRAQSSRRKLQRSKVNPARRRRRRSRWRKNQKLNRSWKTGEEFRHTFFITVVTFEGFVV